MIRQFNSAYEVAYRFFQTGMSAKKTLLEFGMADSKKQPSYYSYKWSEFKKKYPEEYKQAREDYLLDCGIHKANLFTQLYDISQTAVKDADRIRALELLIKFSVEGASDATLVNAANKLQVEIIAPPNPADLNADL